MLLTLLSNRNMHDISLKLKMYKHNVNAIHMIESVYTNISLITNLVVCTSIIPVIRNKLQVSENLIGQWRPHYKKH